MLSLNAQQQDVVEKAEGRCIVAAGPGTGKTHTLAQRIAYLIDKKQIPPSHILAITFTRAAAQEMRQRLSNLLWVDTFHAVALKILKDNGYPFGPGIEFDVVDDDKEKQKIAGPSLSFDEILLYANKLLQEDSTTRERYQKRFQYLLVDEFQDTGRGQYQLMRYLAGSNVCVIGDSDQAIYSFNDDGFSPLEQFKKDYPQHKFFSLSENYRCQATILEAAKQVIARNHASLPRALEARLEKGFPLEIGAYQGPRQEATAIAREIENLIGGSSYFSIDSRWAQKEGETYAYGFQDIVVLYRFHAQARLIEGALAQAGIPYETFGKDSKDLRDFINSEWAHGEHVRLMTLHRAKGLEFPVVFIAGCDTGVLPWQEANIEEERRLFYVGLTRAKKRLFLSYANKRFLFGQKFNAGASPFLQDIQEELRKLQDIATVAKRRSKEIEPTLF